MGMCGDPYTDRAQRPCEVDSIVIHLWCLEVATHLQPGSICANCSSLHALRPSPHCCACSVPGHCTGRPQSECSVPTRAGISQSRGLAWAMRVYRGPLPQAPGEPPSCPFPRCPSSADGHIDPVSAFVFTWLLSESCSLPPFLSVDLRHLMQNRLAWNLLKS